MKIFGEAGSSSQKTQHNTATYSNNLASKPINPRSQSDWKLDTGSWTKTFCQQENPCPKHRYSTQRNSLKILLGLQFSRSSGNFLFNFCFRAVGFWFQRLTANRGWYRGHRLYVAAMKKQILETIGERAPRRQSNKRINGLEALSFCKPFGVFQPVSGNLPALRGFRVLPHFT